MTIAAQERPPQEPGTGKSGWRTRGAVAGLALLCLLAPAAPLFAAEAAPGGSEVLRATLDNGLRVVLVQNALAPVVTTAVNYLAGADETPPGFPGMAHAEEHMMFRGSPGLTGDQLAYLSAMMGGRFDAVTRQTVTQYFFTVPAEDLEVALRIEATRMRGVLDSAKDWSQERGAIEQEVAQDLSSPRYLLYARLREALFKGTSYAHDALGTRASFEKTTAAMLKAFHERWYAPNNAVLVVTGDFEPKPTLAKIEALFGDIPRKTLPARPPFELKPLVPRALKLPSNLPVGLWVIAFRMPGLDSPDYYAADLLADVLNSQRGALYELVPEGKALSADFAFEALPKAALGYASVAFPAGSDPAGLEQEVRRVLARIKEAGVPADLVEAAKRQERRALEFQKNAIPDLAMAWSDAVAIEGLASPEEALARLDKVTVEDVNRVARRYLDLEHAPTALLTPRGSGKPVASKGFGGRESLALGEGKPTELPPWAAQAVGRLSVPPSTLHPVVSTLPNGLTLIVQPEAISDTVTVFGRVVNRPELEVPPGQDGLSLVVDELLGYGTETLDRVEFQTALDAIGAEAQAGTDFSLRVLAEGFERGAELLAENEIRPRFPRDAFEVVKRQVAERAAGRLKSPDYIASRALRAALYPVGDPMLRQALPETITSLKLDDVSAYHRKAFRPDLTTVVVIGKVTPESARATIERTFGAWQAEGPKPNTLLPPVPESRAATAIVPDASRVQNRVTLAETLGLTRADADYYALELGNRVLGGGFYSTRLYRDLRKANGLVYYVGSALEAGKSRALYLVEYACDPANVSRARSIVVRELKDLQATPVGAQELQQAKALLLREIPLDEADVDAIARGLVERATLDLPLDEPTLAAATYLALTAAEVQAAYVKWLRPDDLALVSQGPQPR